MLFLWNDYLDAERLANETEALLEGGMGGVLLLAGNGLPPDTCFDEKWFEAVHAVTRRVRKRRDSVWIYEDLESPYAQRLVEALVSERPEFGQSRLNLIDFVADVGIASQDHDNYPPPQGQARFDHMRMAIIALLSQQASFSEPTQYRDGTPWFDLTDQTWNIDQALYLFEC